MEAAKTWASDKGSEISADLRGMTSQYWYQTIAVGLLEAYERGDKNGYERGREEGNGGCCDCVRKYEAAQTDDDALLRECYLAVNGVRFPELFEKLAARLAPSVSEGKL